MVPNHKPSIHECSCSICQSGNDNETVRFHRSINTVLSSLNERQRRWFVGMLSLQPQPFTDRELALITGLDPKTIRRGRRELFQEPETVVPPHRQRRAGGGRIQSEKKTQNSCP